MWHIGIDYSGEKDPDYRARRLRVFVANGNEPQQIDSPGSPPGRRYNWTRREVAEWLLELKADGTSFIAGIDHALSFPIAYLQAHGLADWDTFLADLVAHWPTHEEGLTVEALREGNARLGNPAWFRLTEKWTSSGKSVFQFDIEGQVAKSTHAGLPWIHAIRNAPGRPIHFWPFDGWDAPAGSNVIAEAYPSIFRRRYPAATRNPDEQDAYATARWLQDSDERGLLERYFHPPLTQEERVIARLEGWILGIS